MAKFIQCLLYLTQKCTNGLRYNTHFFIEILKDLINFLSFKIKIINFQVIQNSDVRKGVE